MQGGLQTQLAQSMQGGSPMNIATPGSPTAMPGLQAPAPTPMPDRSPMSMMHKPALQQAVQQSQMPQQADMTIPGLQDQNPQQPGVQVPTSEAELIIKALDSRMKSISKIHEAVANNLYPAPPEPLQSDEA